MMTEIVVAIGQFFIESIPSYAKRALQVAAEPVFLDMLGMTIAKPTSCDRSLVGILRWQENYRTRATLIASNLA